MLHQALNMQSPIASGAIEYIGTRCRSDGFHGAKPRWRNPESGRRRVPHLCTAGDTPVSSGSGGDSSVGDSSGDNGGGIDGGGGGGSADVGNGGEDCGGRNGASDRWRC